MDLKSDKLLVLDLDETLIHATKTELSHIPADFTFDQYFVYKRPHLDTFLTEAAQHFTLAIWSSAGDIYVDEIVRQITPPDVHFEVVWALTRCSIKRDREADTYYYEKRLDKLKKRGFPLEQILIVDDTAAKTACNYGNAIYIKEFLGDPFDRELPALIDYLLTLKPVENVRLIEKRFWRKPDEST